MSEDKKRRRVEETTVDIFKSENKKGYAGLSYEKVLDFLEISSMTLFTNLESIPTKVIDEDVIEDISKALIKLTKAYGVADEGNESKRHEFVSTVVYNIIAEYYDKNVIIKKEEQIDGEDVKGPVEFVIVHGKLILVIIEAKKQDWDQGRAQLLMQLYNAYIKNIKLGAPKDHVVYGIVTTGYSWEFIWCKGNDINNNNNIKSSITWKYEQKIDPIEINLLKDQEQWKDRVAPLVYKVNYMIDHCLNILTEQPD
ncbi:hypothetical protein BJ944DRAFT_291400 [Cunninghamella echinulata]|nr:hypothetical protein BJ944DRAFT_291400 [Cunninghamella echinulata]